MIYFNNTALESVAPVKIEDVRISPIQTNVTARQRPVQWGADFVRQTGGSRTVAITFALLTMDRDARQKQLEQITQWARSETPGKLILPNKDGYLECICTGMPEPSLRQWWESKLQLTFTTFDNPFFNSITEKAAACGTQFAAVGDAPPLMRIVNEAVDALSDVTYGNGSESMTFSTIPAGNMEIDLNRQTAAVDGQSFMQYYSFGSSFLIPRAGVQTITGTGTVKWRERWE